MQKCIFGLVILVVFAFGYINASETYRSYSEFYEAIAQNYRVGFGERDDNSQELIKEFSNYFQNSFILKLASESKTRFIHHPYEHFALIQLNYFLWSPKRNLLRDKESNGDYYLIQVTENGIRLVERLQLYADCFEIGDGSEIQCYKNYIKSTLVDKFKLDGLNLRKTDSRVQGK